MFGKKMVVEMIGRSTASQPDRRNFLRAAGVGGLGVIGGAALLAQDAPSAAAKENSGKKISDEAILNFALQLEYLEAQFYAYAATGRGIDASLTDGRGSIGKVTGGAKVPFKSKRIRQYAQEIAGDELAHVTFLRKALGGAKAAQPNIDLKHSFTAAARAAGLIGPGQSFNPFADENSFLLGAYIFEDVGVTAYKGASPLISNKTYLEAAAGILAVEAYHAGVVRSALFEKGLADAANAISDARDSLDGTTDLDQGITKRGAANLVPTDASGIAYSRTPGQVLNIVYLNPGQVSQGGFFPNSVNGTLRVSQNNNNS
ncbi:Tat (twin-arginine translocation) pathway signal sequence [Promicromonospora umidemergens]|uniref:Ferritin-like domain-containing protein n=1 Tax=Promicromonospora umidemergens TaxID=629679 RepID=A0ABP8XLV8_9MICO|nr:ferritin-like domain-containing protein [Promicromonospora umidemergens]MCP2282084.1 Tat (twin-arginine translocation) pathway signal sequence [Promicromonospora umidemergens]